MRRVFTTTLLSTQFLINPTYSSLQNIFNQTQTLQNEIQQNELPGHKNLTNILNQLTSGYGCWCNFKKDGHIKGSGKPVDEIDQICRNLHDGYKCSHIDSLEGDPDDECLPTVAEYNPGIVEGSSYMLESENPSEFLTVESGFGRWKTNLRIEDQSMHCYHD